MNWWNIIKRDMEKIRTSTGERLRVKDVGRFQDLLRTLLIEHVIDDLDQAGRRYKITYKDRQLIGNFYEFSMSIRPKTADGRQVHYNFTLIENNEGDYEYVNIYGPELNLTDDDIIESEYELMKMIHEAIGKIVYQDAPKSIDLRIKSEDEKTIKEIALELETANPGYKYDFSTGRLVKKPKEEYAEDIANISQEERRESNNTIEDRMEMDTGLNIEGFINEMRRKGGSDGNY